MRSLIAIDVGFSLAKRRSKKLAKLIDGGPTIIVENGQFLHGRMRASRLTEEDVLEAARASQGLLDMKTVRYAILERNGKISIITD
jgi:uncharacterized membrane protein YcaP (DUF421 family)